jgi:signal peptidase I
MKGHITIFVLMKTIVSSFFTMIFLIASAFAAIKAGTIIPVEGSSMEPFLAEGNRLLVNRMAYGIRLPISGSYVPGLAPKRGDIIVYRSPQDAQRVVKRCVGVPGDSLAVVRGDLLIASSIIIPMRRGQEASFEGLEAIPEGMVFAYGENSGHSVDSRDYGLVSVSSIEGKVVRFRRGKLLGGRP